MSDYLKFLVAKHSRLVAEMNHFIAQAERDNARGGWLCDWSIGIDQARAEAIEIENQIHELWEAAKP